MEGDTWTEDSGLTLVPSGSPEVDPGPEVQASLGVVEAVPVEPWGTLDRDELEAVGPRSAV